MLKVNNVSAGYGSLQILDRVSLEARPNEITVIVGPNGSGKSTLLKTIAGLTNIYQGNITLNDETISSLPPHEIARLGIAYLPRPKVRSRALRWQRISRWQGTLLRTRSSKKGPRKPFNFFPNFLRTGTRECRA